MNQNRYTHKQADPLDKYIAKFALVVCVYMMLQLMRAILNGWM